MSSIPTKQIDGDVAVERNVATGGNANVQGSVRVGHNLRVDGWLEAKNIKGCNKGLFLSAGALREAYPTAHDGWHALVGDTLPAQLYIAEGGRWVAQTNEDGNPVLAGEPSIEIGGLREQLDSMQEALDRQEATQTEHESAIAAAAPRSVELAELDTMGTDGSVGQMLAFATDKENHTLWAVCQNRMKVGTVSVFADFGPHVLYQIITTSNDVVDGKLQGSHRDGRLHTFWRCFALHGNSRDYPVGEWTPWQPFGAQAPIECADEADMAAKAASDAYPEGTQFFIAETD